MQIHIFMTKRIGPRQKFLSPIKYYNKHCTLDISCLITYFFTVRSCVTSRIGPGIEEGSVVIFLNISITPSVPISFTDLLFWIIQT